MHRQTKGYMSGSIGLLNVESCFSLKKDTAARIRFTKLHQDKPQDFGQTKTKLRCLPIMYNTTFEKTNKHSMSAQAPHTNCQCSGRKVIIWTYFQPQDMGTLHSLINHELLRMHIQSVVELIMRL